MYRKTNIAFIRFCNPSLSVYIISPAPASGLTQILSQRKRTMPTALYPRVVSISIIFDNQIDFVVRMTYVSVYAKTIPWTGRYSVWVNLMFSRLFPSVCDECPRCFFFLLMSSEAKEEERKHKAEKVLTQLNQLFWRSANGVCKQCTHIHMQFRWKTAPCLTMNDDRRKTHD